MVESVEEGDDGIRLHSDLVDERHPVPRGSRGRSHSRECLDEAARPDGGCHKVTGLVLHLQLVQAPTLADASLSYHIEC